MTNSDHSDDHSAYGDGYGRLSHAESDRTIIIPEPHTVVTDGVDVHVTYRTQPSFFRAYQLVADFRVELSDAIRWADSSFSSDYSRFDPNVEASEGEWYITEGGEILFQLSYFTRYSIKSGVREYEQKKQAERLKQEVNDSIGELIKDRDTLEDRGFMVNGIDNLLESIKWKVHSLGSYGYYGRQSQTTMEIHQNIGKVQNEIKRLQGVRDRSQLFVDDLIEGKISHSATSGNQAVIDRLTVLSIRSGGFIEAFTPRSLREFYLARVNAQVKEPWSIRYETFVRLNLTINIDDFAPAEVIEDPELQLAPECIDIQARKSLVSYPVEYSMLTIDGVDVPVGIVKLPVNVYKLNAAEYGKRSSFPELPHGIRLFIELTDNGKLIGIRGFDDEALASKYKKYLGGKRRGNVVHLDEFRYTPTMGGEVPPWYQGAKIRWR